MAYVRINHKANSQQLAREFLAAQECAECEARECVESIKRHIDQGSTLSAVQYGFAWNGYDL